MVCGLADVNGTCAYITRALECFHTGSDDAAGLLISGLDSPRLLCSARLAPAYHQHIQRAWPMHSLDSI